MKRVLIPGVILCGADVAQAVDDKNMYMHFFEEMTVYAPVPVQMKVGIGLLVKVLLSP